MKLSIAEIQPMIRKRNPSSITVKYSSLSKLTHLLFDNETVWKGTTFFSSGKYAIGYEVYTELIRFFTTNYTLVKSGNDQSIFST